MPANRQLCPTFRARSYNSSTPICKYKPNLEVYNYRDTKSKEWGRKWCPSCHTLLTPPPPPPPHKIYEMQSS